MLNALYYMIFTDLKTGIGPLLFQKFACFFIQGLTSSGYLLAIGDDYQMCELHPDGNRLSI